MQTSTQKISKLFYNKWPFKIECLVKGGHKVKFYGAEHIRSLSSLDVDVFNSGPLWRKNKETIDKFDLLKFTDAVEPFLEAKEDIQIRTEGAHFNLFCRDPAIKDSICKRLYPWIQNTFGPDTQEELDFLLEQNHKVICSTLPHGKFKFKVLMKGWIAKPEVKENINQYLKKLDPSTIKISPGTVYWLEGNTNYKQDPFFYLVDDKPLLFLRLMDSNIKRVYEYVERDSINTNLQ
jgi:hypothetical protein